MSDNEKFDAIVVGGGVAGCIAAYEIAKAGLEVLLIERGTSAGEKNMTGGRLYSHSLEKVMPGFAEEAPVERKVTKERISMMTDHGATTIEYSSERLGAQGQDSFVVCRGPFDRWLAEKAEEAGAMVACGIRVDDLLIREGRVCGIVAGGEEMESDSVILADGVLSLLAEKAGLKEPLTAHQVGVGAKEIIELGKDKVQDRFGLSEGEGMSWLFAGSVSDGAVGGGFLYTNKESISLGVISTLTTIEKANKTLPQMLDDFKNHDLIRPLIKDGKSVEYSGHLVPEAGISMVPRLYGDGVLIVGDAAGLAINIGYMVRGMDLAIESGRLAAETVIEAKKKNSFSAETLSSYEVKMNDSFVIKDMKQYSKFPEFMESTPKMFNEYPQLLDDIMADMFILDGTPAIPLMKKIRKNVKKVGLRSLIKDGLKGVRSL